MAICYDRHRKPKGETVPETGANTGNQGHGRGLRAPPHLGPAVAEARGLLHFMRQYMLDFTSVASAEFVSLAIERDPTHKETVDVECVTQRPANWKPL